MSLSVDKNSFFDRVMTEPNSGCWLWLGPVTHSGYGRIRNANNKIVLAHRYSVVLHRGEHVEDKFVCHRCDVRSCVNPDHLYVGTHKDNVRDAIARNRFHRWGGARVGEGNPKAKLRNSDVLEIRRKLSDGVTMADLGRQYGVRAVTILKIRERETWREV